MGFDYEWNKREFHINQILMSKPGVELFCRSISQFNDPLHVNQIRKSIDYYLIIDQSKTNTQNQSVWL